MNLSCILWASGSGFMIFLSLDSYKSLDSSLSIFSLDWIDELFVHGSPRLRGRPSWRLQLCTRTSWHPPFGWFIKLEIFFFCHRLKLWFWICTFHWSADFLITNYCNKLGFFSLALLTSFVNGVNDHLIRFLLLRQKFLTFLTKLN